MDKNGPYYSFTEDGQLKINIAYKEFPWLSRIVPQKSMTALYIGRLCSQNLVESPYEIRTLLGYWAHRWHQMDVYLVDTSGKLIRKLGYNRQALSDTSQNSLRCAWHNFQRYFESKKQEPLFDGLQKIGEEGRKEVQFVLTLFEGVLTVYKSPEGETVNDLYHRVATATNFEQESSLRLFLTEITQ